MKPTIIFGLNFPVPTVVHTVVLGTLGADGAECAHVFAQWVLHAIPYRPCADATTAMNTMRLPPGPL